MRSIVCGNIGRPRVCAAPSLERPGRVKPIRGEPWRWGGATCGQGRRPKRIGDSGHSLVPLSFAYLAR